MYKDDLLTTLETLTKQLEENSKVISVFYNTRLEKIKNRLIENCDLFLTDECLVDVTDNNISFRNKEHGKELFYIYFNNNYDYSINKFKYKSLYLNYYTASAYSNNSYELSRLELLGTVAAYLKNNSNKILDVYNSTFSDFDEEYEILRQQTRELESKISKIKKEISDIEKTEILEKLKVGIQFEEPKKIWFKKYSSMIKFLKIIKINKANTKCTINYLSSRDQDNEETNIDLENLITQINSL